MSQQGLTKKRPVNLTVSEVALNEAEALSINISREAEAGIVAAVKRVNEQKWLKENEAAILAHNTRVEKSGTLLTPAWAKS